MWLFLYTGSNCNKFNFRWASSGIFFPFMPSHYVFHLRGLLPCGNMTPRPVGTVYLWVGERGF